MVVFLLRLRQKLFAPTVSSWAFNSRCLLILPDKPVTCMPREYNLTRRRHETEIICVAGNCEHQRHIMVASPRIDLYKDLCVQISEWIPYWVISYISTFCVLQVGASCKICTIPSIINMPVCVRAHLVICWWTRCFVGPITISHYLSSTWRLKLM